MTDLDIFEKVEKYISKDECDTIVNHVYGEIFESNDLSHIKKNLSYLQIHVEETEAIFAKDAFCLFINEILPNKMLKDSDSDYSMLKSMKLLMPYRKQENPVYEFKSIVKLISDFNLDRNRVCFYLLEAIRYRAGIMDSMKETMFANTYFAFNSNLKELEDELKSYSDYEELKKLKDSYSDHLFENYVEKIEFNMPF